MRAEAWAVLTALCWGIGSLLEKRGVKIGGLHPVMGTTIRTAFSLLLLFFVSYPYWAQIRKAGTVSISLIAVGGGVIAGGLGIIFLYAGLKSGNLSSVMTIAFCLAPVVGAILGYLVLNERLAPIQLAGVVLCVVGAALVTYFRQAGPVP
jgi:uncharacterized membrane protein